MKRRKFTPEFKSKVVMQMLREEKTISEIVAYVAECDFESKFLQSK